MREGHDHFGRRLAEIAQEIRADVRGGAAGSPIDGYHRASIHFCNEFDVLCQDPRFRTWIEKADEFGLPNPPQELEGLLYELKVFVSTLDSQEEHLVACGMTRQEMEQVKCLADQCVVALKDRENTFLIRARWSVRDPLQTFRHLKDQVCSICGILAKPGARRLRSEQRRQVVITASAAGTALIPLIALALNLDPATRASLLTGAAILWGYSGRALERVHEHLREAYKSLEREREREQGRVFGRETEEHYHDRDLGM